MSVTHADRVRWKGGEAPGRRMSPGRNEGICISWGEFFLEKEEQISSRGPQSLPAPLVLKAVTPDCSFFVSRGFTPAWKEEG